VTTHATPDGKPHPTLTAVLSVRGGAKALEFYATAFGAQEILRVPGPEGRIDHAQMRMGESLLFLADESPHAPPGYGSPPKLGGTSCVMYVTVPDADASYAQAVRAGAEGLIPVQEQHWGNREGLVRDPFGHLWALSSPKRK
jgi:PhnB protein